MKIEEYKEFKAEIDKEYQMKLRELAAIFATANSPVSVGDFVTDHIGTIKVEKVSLYLSLSKDVPSCVYYGPCYTKKNVLYKSGEKREVHQMNIKSDRG